MSKPIRMPQAEEQVVLEELELQLVDLENLPRFQSLLRRHHYLGAIKPVGERLYYAARWHGQWLALLVFCAAAKHLRHREKWIGWTEEQRRKRLGLVVNNARFLVLPHWSLPNLATKVMGLCAQRLSADWQARYGHPVWLAESFVDTQLFRGTAYKASGWTELGPTQGYGRCGQDYYVKHDRPKALFVKELKRKARRSLCAEHLPELVARAVESKVPPRPTQRVGELRSLREHFARVPDFRGRVESYPSRSSPRVGTVALSEQNRFRWSGYHASSQQRHPISKRKRFSRKRKAGRHVLLVQSPSRLVQSCAHSADGHSHEWS